MQPHTVRSAHHRQQRRRVGRGNGSGAGTYSGRGSKGQKARTGGGVKVGFEGGQNRLIKGLPMLRGFKNMFRTAYQPVNVEALAALPDEVTEVTPQVLAAYRLVDDPGKPVKLLARGDLSRAFQISSIKTSGAARAKITAAGGTVAEA